ncbi:hydrolase [Arthrobacter sp. RIT-PI-e]|uniref:CocE/NonD family hydrolase n=1 Tax=Arthrobacter sp. RIT-PI-e TaxID=1681197 RepID=UPI00067628AA|nr:CocE/NonD family hydrolase [Arthrobacter sp. RIT-PI-e]KNC13452.1 hydrolase [Arthrobacter sp. RIT-PI-e]
MSRSHPSTSPGTAPRRRRAVVGLITATALLSPMPAVAAPVVTTPATPTLSQKDRVPAEPDDPFFSYDRPAEYDVVREDVRVPVRDGTELACQLYRPGTSPTDVAPGTFPGIVYEYTAYARNAEQFGEEAGYFVEHGYNALVCQARGSGESPGLLDPFSPQEQRDNYDVIEWLAQHPSSTGKIGQMGVSYGGHSTLLVAVNKPPHLEAIIPANGIHDWYENTIYHGGIYSPRIRSWQASTAPSTLETYAEHPLYDDFWRDRSVMSRWENLTIPTLEINGWYDRYRDGMVKNYQARPENVWLVSGPWEHGWPSGQPEDIGLGGYLAWWDHWLQDDQAAPLPAEHVTSYEISSTGVSAGWQQFDQWPADRARELTLHLRHDGSLSRGAGRPGEQGFTVNTESTPPEPHEQLTFSTAPMRQDMVLAGDATADLRTSFTAADGNIALVLYDQAPDGTTTRVTEGWLKASHRDTHTRLSPVEPGETYDMGVHIWPTHYRIPAGHRLVLRVSSDDHPQIESTAPDGDVTVKTGARGSTLKLTVLHDTRR